MFRKISIFSLVICSTAIIIAANFETKEQRQHKKQSHYPHLLSDAYKIIEQYELEKGTFGNIDYFKARSNKVIKNHNPLPLIANNDIHNIQKRRELRLQRFELVRFIDGYAKKLAPKDVAIMHAAFDCRIKNISINPNMDNQCQQLFIKHKTKAAKIVENYLNKKPTIKVAQNKAQYDATITTSSVQSEAPKRVIPKIITMQPIVEKGESYVPKIQQPLKVAAVKPQVKPVLEPIERSPFELPKSKIEPKKVTEVAAVKPQVKPVLEPIERSPFELPKSKIEPKKVTEVAAVKPQVKPVLEPIERSPFELPEPKTESKLVQKKVAQIAAVKPQVKPVLEPIERSPFELPKSKIEPKKVTEVAAVKPHVKPVLEPIERSPFELPEPKIEPKKVTQIAAVKPQVKPVLEPIERSPFELPEPKIEPKKVTQIAAVKPQVKPAVKPFEIKQDKVEMTQINPVNDIEVSDLSYTPLKSMPKIEKKVFNTMSLKKIVEKALNNNPDRMVALAQYYTSQAQIDVASSGYYPVANLVLGAGREANDPFGTTQTQVNTVGYNNSNSANFRLEQMLFDGFITPETVAQRLEQAKASRLNERKVSEEIILSAVQIYMQLRQFQKTVTAAQENVTALKDIEKLVDMRVKIGESNRTEKKYIEGRIASAQQNLINAQVGLGNAKNALEFITGEKLDFNATLPDVKQDKKFVTIERFLDKAFKNNTQISLLNAQKNSAEHQLEATLGRYYPKLNFAVEAGHIEDRGGYTGNVRNAVAKFELTIPIYEGGIRSALVRQRKSEINEVKARQLLYRRQLKQDLKTAYQTRLGAIDQIETTSREIKSNISLEKLNKQQFRYGEKDIFVTDLVESRERVFSAKINKIRAETDYITSYYNIQRSLGEVFQEFCTHTCQVI